MASGSPPSLPAESNSAALQFNFSPPQRSTAAGLPSSLLASPAQPPQLGPLHISDDDQLSSNDDDDDDDDDDNNTNTGAAAEFVPSSQSARGSGSSHLHASGPLDGSGDSEEDDDERPGLGIGSRVLGSPRPGGPSIHSDAAASSPNDAMDTPPGGSSYLSSPGAVQELWTVSSSPPAPLSSSSASSSSARGQKSTDYNRLSNRFIGSQLHTSGGDTSLHFDESDSASEQDERGGEAAENDTVVFFRALAQQEQSGQHSVTRSPSSYRDAADEEHSMANSDTGDDRQSADLLSIRRSRSILSIGPRPEGVRKKSVRWLDSETNQKLTQVFLLDYEYDRKPAAFSLPSRIPMPNPNMPDDRHSPTRIPMIIVSVCILAILAVILILLLRHFGII